MMSKDLRYELDKLDGEGILFTVLLSQYTAEEHVELVTKCGSFRTRIPMTGDDMTDVMIVTRIRSFSRYVNGTPL